MPYTTLKSVPNRTHTWNCACWFL